MALRPRASRTLIEALESRRLLSTTFVSDLAGNATSETAYVGPLAVAAATSEVSIWGDAVTPAVLADPDNVPIELGVKFRTNVAGSVTGLRFYKDATNTGTHVGHLWAADGTLLAEATFTSETESGWQTVTFATPVDIQPDTTYVASYHTEVGHYSVTENEFGAAGVDNGPLHALANGEDGGNGVYVYGASAFPSQASAGTNYWVDVIFSPASEPPTGSRPAAPTDLVATAVSPTQINLTWTDNATDETEYRIERSTDGVTFALLTTVPADTANLSDLGLSPSTHYYYRVFAANAAGDSDPSNTADATTEDETPPPPTGGPVYLSDLTPTTSFNGAGPAEADTSNGGSAAGDGATIQIGGVIYQKGWGVHAYSELEFDLTGKNFTTFESDYGIDDETNGKGSVVFQVYLDGNMVFDSGVVTAGLARHVMLDVTGVKTLILVVNDGGDGISNDHADWADAVLYSSGTGVTKPAAPTDLSATATSSSQIDLVWIDNATDETGYRVERSTDGITFELLATLPPDATNLSDLGLSPATQYYYRVLAVNSAGESDPSNTADATTTSEEQTTPAAPTDLVATAISSTQIDLTWTDNATDETGYRVERSTDGLTFTLLTTLSAGVTSLSDQGLSPSTQYYYRMYAVNSAGDSDPSNVADATTEDEITPPPPDGTPIKLTGTAIGSAGSWNNGVNTFDKALDGDVHTYFDAPVPNGNFVGLVLPTPAVITSVRVYPRWTFAWRMTGGKIQGSNDNATWVDLATITSQPAEGTYTTIQISNATAFKYVRYLSPNDSFGNVAEVEFYTTTQTPPPPDGTPVKLTGTLIGSAGSWNNGGNTFDKALDGDVHTFFDAPTPAGNYVGLSLGSATVITSARVYPRGGFAWRLTGGKIQGSNDNTTWVDLATIATQPSEGTFTTLTITNTTAFKYVRFLSPSEGFGNVAEVEFYGLAGPITPPPTSPAKLTGALVGSAGSWNNGSNTFDKALDGDVHTFFDAPTPAGNFVGLSLGSAAVLTSARLYPRGGFAWRVTGGKIQGSNDNATWTDLATVAAQPPEGTFSTLAITDPAAYKYVRYLSPSEGFGNIAEVEFYGVPV